MAVGKRLSTDQPLTEHDVAERLDKAMLRVLRILMEADAMGIRDDVLQSRYHTNVGNVLAAELAAWGIEPQPLDRAEDTSDRWQLLARTLRVDDPAAGKPTPGEIAVIMRRMEALKNAIDQPDDRTSMEFVFDQVHRALTKAFDLPR